MCIRDSDNHFDVCGAADDGREGVECKLYIVIIQLRFYAVYCCIFAADQYIAMLHTSIGIGIGYWYR